MFHAIYIFTNQFTMWDFYAIILTITTVAVAFYLIRFLEGYRKTIKETDMILKIVDHTIGDFNVFLDDINMKVEDLNQFFDVLTKAGVNLEIVNNKFTSVASFIEKTPSKIISALIIYMKVDKMSENNQKLNISLNEEFDNKMKDFIKGAIVGGLAVAFLTPKNGKEMQILANEKLEELREKAKEINVADVKEKILAKIDELQEFIKTANKDEIINKVFDEIKKLYETIRNYISDTADIAKDKINTSL